MSKQAVPQNEDGEQGCEEDGYERAGRSVIFALADQRMVFLAARVIERFFQSGVEHFADQGDDPAEEDHHNLEIADVGRHADDRDSRHRENHLAHFSFGAHGVEEAAGSAHRGIPQREILIRAVRFSHGSIISAPLKPEKE